MHRRADHWRGVATLALLVLPPCGANAESVVIAAHQPARFAEPSALRRMVIGAFGGPGGPALASALSEQLSQPGPEGSPWFTLIAQGGGAGAGVISGNVDVSVSNTDSTQRRSRCVEGAGFFKCKRSVEEVVNCRQQVSIASVTVRVERLADHRIVYAATKPYRDASFWCEGDRPPDSVDSKLQAVIGGIARAIVEDISPTTASYKVRLLENTQGLSKPGAATFKAAIKTSMKNFPGSCDRWRALAAEGEKAAALYFATGVCAEQAGDLAGAGQLFAQASAMMPGDKTIAEGAARVRGLAAARAQAQAQATRRAAAERAERDQMLAEQAKARREVAETQRAARAAGAAARARQRQHEAAAAAAKNSQRQQVAERYGADVADAILSGTVRKGMNAAQVRAAMGGGCRVEAIAPGEEQWFCGGKRIVFSGGRVTLVR